MQSVLYGKAIVCIANILATSNQAAATMPTKAGAPVIETRASLARKHLAIIAVIAITGFGIACPNNNSNPWTLRDSRTTGVLQSVTYGGPSGRELFVAVGGCRSDSNGNCIDNAPILTSPDGITWTDRGNGVREFLGSVTYGGPSGRELFVAVGSAILTSPDGITWTVKDITSGLSSVTYGGASGSELFVAVGSAILTSPDGITWTDRGNGVREFLESVTYGEARGPFVAVGSCPKDSNNDCSGNGVILTSPRGITWTSQTSGLQSDFYGIASKTFGSGTIFAAVGGCSAVFSDINASCSHSNPIVTSSNGISWGTQENPTERFLIGVTATGDSFLAVGFCPLDSKNERCIGNASIVTSSDGIAWTAEDSGVKTILADAVYGNGISVIIGQRTDCANIFQRRDCSGNTVILTK